MVLHELWNMKPVSEIAISYQLERGLVQNLMSNAAMEASCLLKYCEEIEEFWAFRELFKNLSQRLSNICTVELVPLMQLPCVKLVRFSQNSRLKIFISDDFFLDCRFREEQSCFMPLVIKKSKMLPKPKQRI